MTPMKLKKTLPPAPILPVKSLTERQQRAALIPKFEKSLLTVSPEQSDFITATMNTDHPKLIVEIIKKSLAGNTDAADDKPDANTDAEKNIALQHLIELKPTSYLETMLITQMIQVQNAACKCMNLAFNDNLPFAGKELNANLAVKMHRTFCAQIEALQKLRGKGGQRVTVEHVHINSGAQAIIGDVTHQAGGGGRE
jgi:hypothetical protein